MLKKYMKEIFFGSLIVIVLIYVVYANFIGNRNFDTSTTKITQTSVDESNSETKQETLTNLLNDLDTVDSCYNKSKANALSNGERGTYIDNIGKQYIALIEKTYNSISDLENDKEKTAAEKQTAIDNVKKAGDDVELSYKIAGGGSGASTDIPYAKMNTARKEVCNALKTYFGCADDILEWKEMKDDTSKESDENKSEENISDQRKFDLILDYRVALNRYIKADPPVTWNLYAIDKIKPLKCDEAYYVGCTGYPYVFRFEYNKNDKEARLIKRIEKDTDFEYLDN